MLAEQQEAGPASEEVPDWSGSWVTDCMAWCSLPDVFRTHSFINQKPSASHVKLAHYGRNW